MKGDPDRSPEPCPIHEGTHMVDVMASGVFDIVHMGHIYYLRAARERGDRLVGVVACDETAKRMKHPPVMPAEMRLALIRELRVVDEAVLGGSGDPYDTVKRLKPDIIALGYDQVHREEEIGRELEKRGLGCRVVRLEKFASDLESTQRIIRKIIDWALFNEKMKSIEGG